MHDNMRRVVLSMIAYAVALAGTLLASFSVAAADGWRALGPPGINNIYNSPFAVDPTSPSTLYTVVNGTTLMKTVDGGGQWAAQSTAPVHLDALVIDPAAADTLYAIGGTAPGPGTSIYKSVDGGAQWTRTSDAIPASLFERLVIAPSRPATLYAAQAGRAVWKTIDAGASWIRINDGLPSAGTELPFTYAYVLAVDPMDADTVYAGVAAGSGAKIFKLDHGTNRWHELPLVLPADAIVSALAIDPVTPSVLYAAYGVFAPNDALVTSGIFKSLDGGDTWVAMQNPPSDANGMRIVTAFAIDPRAPSRLYATASFGVFMSTDAALSWVPIDSDLPNGFVWGLFLDRTGRLLRTASYAGVFEYRPTPATAQVQTAVEYGFRSWRDDGYSSYFVTSASDEIAALDRGAFNDPAGSMWERTGKTFNVWTGPANGAVPTCRFFNPGLGVEHFYTPYAAECATVSANADGHWQYEGTAFYLVLPDQAGSCPAGTRVLYRLYSGRAGAPQHRLTTSADTFNAMRLNGWIFEGDARTAAFACVPASGPAPG